MGKGVTRNIWNKTNTSIEHSEERDLMLQMEKPNNT